MQGNGRGSRDQSIAAALCHCYSHTFPLLHPALHLMVFSFLQGTSTCSKERSSIAAGGCLLHIDLHGLQGDRLPHHGPFQRLQGNFSSSSGSTPTPSFFNDLGVCKVVAVTDSYSSHNSGFLVFFFFLKYISPEVSPPQLCPMMGGFDPSGAICVLRGAASASPHTLPEASTEVSTRTPSPCTPVYLHVP